MVRRLKTETTREAVRIQLNNELQWIAGTQLNANSFNTTWEEISNYELNHTTSPKSTKNKTEEWKATEILELMDERRGFYELMFLLGQKWIC